MKDDIGCLRAIEAFYAYLDGELDDPEAIADFEHHMEHCRSCYSRADMEKALNRRLRDTARQETPAALRDRVSKLMEKF
jgi:anti-sigma factor (TIGR02949 family)